MDNSVPTSSELLHSFLDGELEHSMESPLFSALHTSSELRAEMRELLALQRAVRNDKVALVPPIASTAAVFGALGMSTSMLVSSGWLSALWSKIWIPLATTLVGSAITWYAVSPSSTNTQTTSTTLGADNNAARTEQSAPSPSQASASAPITAIHDTVVVTKVVPRYVSERSAEPKTIIKTVEKTVYVPVVDDNSDITRVAALRDKSTSTLSDENNDAHATNPSSSSSLSSASTNGSEAALQTRPTDIIINELAPHTSFVPLMVRRTNPSAMLSIPDVVNASAVSAPRIVVPENFKRSFIGTVRGLSGSSYVDVSIPDNGVSGLNNVAVGGYYMFNEVFGLGLELGRESFAMSFKGVVDGTLKRYEANPSLTWGAVQAQIYPFPSLMESGWQPYLQANLGFTNYGFLTKGILGTYYTPTAHLRLMAGLEASGLFYSVQGTGYTTPKLGITYGIGYQF